MVIRREDLKAEEVKKRYGGSFPTIKGRKYRYPKPENEEAWLKLVCRALNYRERQIKAARERKPFKRDSKLEYLIYHCLPDQRKRRSQRNIDRKKMQEKTGKALKGKHVHHKDQVKLAKPVVMDGKKHLKMHGLKRRQQASAKKPLLRGAK